MTQSGGRAVEPREGYALIMPEIEGGKPGSGEMVRWLIGKSSLCSSKLLANKSLFQPYMTPLGCTEDQKATHGIPATRNPCSSRIHTGPIEMFVAFHSVLRL